MSGLGNYIKGAMAEMKQVTWPTQKQTFFYTILVVVVSIIVAALIGAFDAVFVEGLDLFRSLTLDF